MTVRRDLTVSGKAPLDHVPDIDETVNYHSGLLLGQLTSVSDSGGADTLTGNLREASGFTNGSLQGGATVKLIAPSDCIGPSTLAINGESALAIVAADGTDLEADAWAADDLLTLDYDEDGGEWRLVSAGVSAATPSSTGSGLLPFVYYFDADGTLTFSDESDVFIVAIGAGGSGGVSIQVAARAQGGSSGAVALKKATLAASTALTVVVGQGGASVGSASGTPVAGNDGGASSVSGGGVNITANGGKGGQVGNSVTLTKQTAATATGGDHNFSGGRAGGMTQSGATGGAAPNPFGTGFDSGEVTTTGGKATGGASPKAASANDVVTAATGFTDIGVLWTCILTSPSNGGTGSVSPGTPGGDGGKFAGGGAAMVLASTATDGGDGGIGAGGGGAGRTVAGGTSNSGSGGDGMVLILSSKPATKA